MKYLFLIASFIFSTYSFGQFQKGTWTINANSAGLFIKPSERGSTLSLSTDIGYFPKKWLLIGAELSYDRSTYYTLANNEISVNPYLRFYFDPAKKTKFYGQIGSDISFNLSEYYSSFYESYELKSSQRLFRPEIGLGFNRFIGKHIAFEAGIDMSAFQTGKFKNDYYGSSSIFEEGILIMPHLGIRLFLNTTEQDDKSPTDYLQTGTYTVGIFANSLYYADIDYSVRSMLFNYQYFVADNFSVGASFQLAGEGNENVVAFSPTIEWYIPSTSIIQFVPTASVNIFSEEIPTTYNFGLKANTFIQSNISLWAGPLALYSPQSFKEWYFYAGVGVNYFIAGKKNRTEYKDNKLKNS